MLHTHRAYVQPFPAARADSRDNGKIASDEGAGRKRLAARQISIVTTKREVGYFCRAATACPTPVAYPSMLRVISEWRARIAIIAVFTHAFSSFFQHICASEARLRHRELATERRQSRRWLVHPRDISVLRVMHRHLDMLIRRFNSVNGCLAQLSAIPRASSWYAELPDRYGRAKIV